MHVYFLKCPFPLGLLVSRLVQSTCCECSCSLVNTLYKILIKKHGELLTAARIFFIFYNTAQFHRNTSGWMGGHALNEMK